MLEKAIGSGRSCQERPILYHLSGEARFLEDLKQTAKLTTGQKIAAGAVGAIVPGVITSSSLGAIT